MVQIIQKVNKPCFYSWLPAFNNPTISRLAILFFSDIQYVVTSNHTKLYNQDIK